ncbi:MAG: hypothetical protein EPO51_20380 [Phenylobacterium sp.]|uniref:hypothetical protein n=1 Tax=Phenylobacterium sp. TaxID=1871053 RepID=UPI001222E402|nr:hypothetical protein [Phenylobacterium sp.]TAJ69886.1 MAG: hypothetical protein EPO51_20380 [Phenylobacterium sp.]
MNNDEAQFEIEIADDGSVRLTGKAAVPVLSRLVMAAKFQMELNAEHLLSPYVDLLLDELTRVAPMPTEDWNNPANLTPPEIHAAVEVVCRYRDQHEPERDLQDLLRVALKPFDVPLERLSLSRRS